MARRLARTDAATASARISGVVEMLLTGKREGPEELAAVLGCSRSTAYNKLAGVTEKGWTADDVAALASHFGVPVTTFFAGPDALISSIAGSDLSGSLFDSEQLSFDLFLPKSEFASAA